LGFPLEGAILPLDAEESLLVRAFRQSRLIISYDVAELAGGVVPEDAIEAIREAIGPRTFAAVPIAASSGALGCLLFEKPDESGFSAEDRDVLVAYADRVGADLESHALTEEVERLEALRSDLGDPPVLYVCNAKLHIESSADAAHPRGALWDALSIDREPVF